MKCNEMTLINLTIGKGEYGIGAPAVPYSDKLPTYLRITDINDDGTLNYSNLKSVDSKNSYKYFLNKNDIVFARTGASTGRNFFYDGPEKKYVYAGFLIKFSINPKKVNPYFIKYYCQSIEYYNWINSVKTGSTRGNINAKMLAELPIKLPSRKQQDKMVKILSALDDKIELNNKINKNLEEMAQAIFTNRFPNFKSGNYTIGDFITPKRGKGLLSKNAIKGLVPVVAGGLQPSTFHNEANTEPPVISISASGANAGYVNLWEIPIWSSDSSFIDKTISFDIYFWYLLLKIRQQEIFDSQTGSAQPHIYPKHIMNMQIPNFKIDKIKIFTDQITPIFNLMGKNQEETNKLIQLRDTLLPKLMSGELDVSNLDI